MEHMTSYLPKAVIAKVLLSKSSDHDEFFSVILFADISGFTKLSVALLEEGEIGVEKLSVRLNDFFGEIITKIESFGGDVSKIAGDAVICVWSCGKENRAQQVANISRVLNCARSLITIDDGKEREEFPLTLHCGIVCGPMLGLHLGGKKREHAVFDGPSDSVLCKASTCIEDAGVSEIVCSQEVFDLARECEDCSKRWDFLPLPKEGGAINYRVTPLFTRVLSHKRRSSLAAIGQFMRTRSQSITSKLTRKGSSEVSSLSTETERTRSASVSSPDSVRRQVPTSSSLSSSVSSSLPGAVMTQDSKSPLLSPITSTSAQGTELLNPNLRPSKSEIPKDSKHSSSPIASPALQSLTISVTTPNMQIESIYDTQLDLRDIYTVQSLSMKQLVSELCGKFSQAEIRKLLMPYVPSSIESRLSGDSSWLAELRRVSVLFISMSNMIGCQDVSKFNDVLCSVQEIIMDGEGFIRQFLQDDKGIVLIAVFGLPPYIHENDPARAVTASQAILSKLISLDVNPKIGVTTGKVFVGAIGCDIRREFAVVGAPVNLSARLMNAAEVQDILVDETTKQEAQKEWTFEQVGSTVAKGFKNEIMTFRPTRAREMDKSLAFGASASLFGRESEVDSILDSLKSNIDTVAGNKAKERDFQTDGKENQLPSSGKKTGSSTPKFVPQPSKIHTRQSVTTLQPSIMKRLSTDQLIRLERESLDSHPLKARKQNTKLSLMRKSVSRDFEGSVYGSLASISAPDIFIIEGESGIGKTRLMKEVQTQAEGIGVSSFCSVCTSNQRRQPYFCWNRILKDMLVATCPPTLDKEVTFVPNKAKAMMMDFVDMMIAAKEMNEDQAKQLKERLPLLNAILPCLGLEETDLVRRMGPEARGITLNSLMTEFLRWVSRTKPVVIFLDDIHWMDSLSLSLLASMALRASGCVIVAALVRSEQSFPEIDRIIALPSCHHMILSGLYPSEIRNLAMSYLGVTALPPLVGDLITDRSQGNPHFIEELVSALIQDGSIVLHDSTVILAEGITGMHDFKISDSLEGTIASRLGALSENLLLLAKIASCIGRELEVDILFEIFPVSNLQATHKTEQFRELNKLLEELVRKGILTHSDRGFMFKHASVGEIAYKTMLFSKRRDLHASIVSAIEEKYQDNIQDHYNILAHHSAKTTNYTQSFRYHVLAGEQSLKRGAFRESEHRYSEALKLLHRPGGIKVKNLLHEEVRVLCKLCIANIEVANYAIAREQGELALTKMGYVTGTGIPQLLHAILVQKGFYKNGSTHSLATMVMVAQRLRKPTVAKKYDEKCVQIVEDESAASAKTYANCLISASWIGLGDIQAGYERALVSADEGLEVGDMRYREISLSAMCYCLFEWGRFWEGVDVAKSIIDSGEARDCEPTILFGTYQYSQSLTLIGNFELALEASEHAGQLIQNHPDAFESYDKARTYASQAFCLMHYDPEDYVEYTNIAYTVLELLGDVPATSFMAIHTYTACIDVMFSTIKYTKDGSDEQKKAISSIQNTLKTMKNYSKYYVNSKPWGEIYEALYLVRIDSKPEKAKPLLEESLRYADEHDMFRASTMAHYYLACLDYGDDGAKKKYTPTENEGADHLKIALESFEQMEAATLWHDANFMMTGENVIFGDRNLDTVSEHSEEEEEAH